MTHHQNLYELILPMIPTVYLYRMSAWKYEVKDYAFTNNFLYPFWDMLLSIMPHWVAPNVLTLIGFFFVIVTYLHTKYYYEPVMIPFIIMGLFISSTLDGLDGKQARRIKNETAFGELLDHTIDLINLYMITTISVIILNLGETNTNALYIISMEIFCFTHLQAYADGYVTITKWGGPNEVLCLLFIMFVSTYFMRWDYIIQKIPFNMVLSIINLTWIIYLQTHKKFDKHLIRDSMFKFSVILSIITALNLFGLINSFQIMCIFVIVNGELIVTKMANSPFRNIVLFYCLVSLLHPIVALIYVSMYLLTTFYSIKIFFGHPLFKTFETIGTIKTIKTIKN